MNFLPFDVRVKSNKRMKIEENLEDIHFYRKQRGKWSIRLDLIMIGVETSIYFDRLQNMEQKLTILSEKKNIKYKI